MDPWKKRDPFGKARLGSNWSRSSDVIATSACDLAQFNLFDCSSRNFQAVIIPPTSTSIRSRADESPFLLFYHTRSWVLSVLWIRTVFTRIRYNSKSKPRGGKFVAIFLPTNNILLERRLKIFSDPIHKKDLIIWMNQSIEGQLLQKQRQRFDLFHSFIPTSNWT